METRENIRRGLLSLSACGIVGVDCTGDYVYGVRVRAFDSESGAPVVESLAGHLLQSSYAETMDVWENTLMGVGERPGTYSVVVTAPTYEDWVRTGIVVEDKRCHLSVERAEGRPRRGETYG